MKQAFIDSTLNRRTRELMSTLTRLRAECDAIQEKEKVKDMEYAELELKCNDSLGDLEKNRLVVDLRE
ncbi:hypothetical protein Tco_0670543 [Tanacetum coccineum]